MNARVKMGACQHYIWDYRSEEALRACAGVQAFSGKGGQQKPTPIESETVSRVTPSFPFVPPLLTVVHAVYVLGVLIDLLVDIDCVVANGNLVHSRAMVVCMCCVRLRLPRCSGVHAGRRPQRSMQSHAQLLDQETSSLLPHWGQRWPQ